MICEGYKKICKTVNITLCLYNSYCIFRKNPIPIKEESRHYSFYLNLPNLDGIKKKTQEVVLAGFD